MGRISYLNIVPALGVFPYEDVVNEGKYLVHWDTKEEEMYPEDEERGSLRESIELCVYSKWNHNWKYLALLFVVSLNHLNGHSYRLLYLILYNITYIYIYCISLFLFLYAYLIKSMYILSMGTEELVRMSFPIRFDEFTCTSLLNFCVCRDIRVSHNRRLLKTEK